VSKVLRVPDVLLQACLFMGIGFLKTKCLLSYVPDIEFSYVYGIILLLLLFIRWSLPIKLSWQVLVLVKSIYMYLFAVCWRIRRGNNCWVFIW